MVNLEALEGLLVGDDGSFEYEQQLRFSVRTLPSLRDVPDAERRRWEALGAELMYRANRPEELIEWLRQSEGREASIWECFALFDVGNVGAALKTVRALDAEKLLPWAVAKMKEIEVCSAIRLDPTSVTDELVDELRRVRNGLDQDQVTLMTSLYEVSESDGFLLVADAVRTHLLEAFKDELVAVRSRVKPT